MSEEVKEILEALKPHNDIIKEYPLKLSIEEQKLLLDYITNLQKENEEVKDQKKKAIEWIKKHITTYQKNDIAILDWDTFADPRNLLKILGGDE